MRKLKMPKKAFRINILKNLPVSKPDATELISSSTSLTLAKIVSYKLYMSAKAPKAWAETDPRFPMKFIILWINWNSFILTIHPLI